MGSQEGSLLQQNKPTLTDIPREHNIDRTYPIFELFDVSPAQSAEREASEAEAAREEARAVREISERETSGEVAIQSHARPANEQIYEIDERLAENAQVFLEALNDSYRSEMVSKLRREVSMAIKRNKDFLEGSYLGELKEIQAQRAALDTWERNAKNAMINGDSQCLDDPDKILASEFSNGTIDVLVPPHS
ncbi:hypothetical protein BJX68DRAFT_258678 [Aspergillus pseudodeflectus]|uniref:Uncharacterized protein n=1 Tax=Aspergillus pseudodeflectus TaxID=176178 RepID=A0ABR4JJM0_9EURO